jgi:8-oxo-dGTP diphosphatase
MPTYEYPRPAVTVDCVVFGISQENELQVLLVERADEPFRGRWALPGGFVQVSDGRDQGEGLEEAARRELAEETSVKVAHLEQLATFGQPGRDPRGRVISVAYMALVRSAEHVATAGSDAAGVKWWPVNKRIQLAFDHADVLEVALARLRAKVRYAPIGFALLPRVFPLSELQSIYEAVLGRALDRRNFHRRILAMGILAEAGKQTGVPHRAATLYRFDRAAYDRAVADGFHFEITGSEP